MTSSHLAIPAAANTGRVGAAAWHDEDVTLLFDSGLLTGSGSITALLSFRSENMDRGAATAL
jgi:hypothetical protein